MRGFKSERNMTGGNGPKNQESLSYPITHKWKGSEEKHDMQCRGGTNPVRKTSFTVESISQYNNSKGNPL